MSIGCREVEMTAGILRMDSVKVTEPETPVEGVEDRGEGEVTGQQV
jgi:hypothetical protein